MTQESNSTHRTAQEQRLQLTCGPREQLHMEVTVRWVRQPAEVDGAGRILGQDPGPPQEKQPGGNSLRADPLPPLEADGDASVQRQRMTVVCGPDEAVALHQWIDVTSSGTDDAGGTVRLQGTDPGNQGSKQPGGNPLRA